MARGDIILSPKYGVNPSLGKCLYCAGDSEVVLFGRLTRAKAEDMFGKTVAGSLQGDDDDVEAPRHVMTTPKPCDGCEVFHKAAEEGVWFVYADQSDTPTGKTVCLREEAFRRIVKDPEALRSGLENRVVIVPHEVWHMLGLDEPGTAS